MQSNAKPQVTPTQSRMKTLIVVLSIVVAASADYVKSFDHVMYKPDGGAQVTLEGAREYCESIGGVLPFDLNVTSRNDVGILFRHASNNSFWLDIEKKSDGKYYWSDSHELVKSELWKPSEPQGEGNVVLRREQDGTVGLYVHPNRNDTHLVTCQLKVNTRNDVKYLHKQWANLTYAELEPLEDMLIDLNIGDRTVVLEEKIDELTKKTDVLLHLVQRLIER